MAVYVVAGASRGLGYGFIEELARNTSNTVIGLVRNKAAADERVAKDGFTNVTIYQADITDLAALNKAAAETDKLTEGRGVDYLINNAAVNPESHGLINLDSFEDKGEALGEALLETYQTNVIGVANAITAFLPLIKKSKTKKVITISTGMADIDLVNDFSVAIGAPYAVSKGATNVLIAKYNAVYGSQGILFMSVSPGLVDTAEGKTMPPEVAKLVMPMIEAFQKAEPTFKGPITVQDSVTAVLKLADRATVKEFGGKFVSHHGDKKWLAVV